MAGSFDADLVFEGGGVKGIGLVGAWSVLAGAGCRARRVAGTSAGAIVGSLVAAGVDAGRLEELMREVDYEAFKDKGVLDHLGPVGMGLSALFEKGVYEGEHFRDWLDARLRAVGVRTFGDLRVDDAGSSLAPERSYRLVVIVSDVSRGRLVRLPWDYADYGLDPDQQVVADAVRASMSIPFFYEPARLQAVGPGAPDGRSYLVDGGILSNFPVDVFDRTDGLPPRWPTFGVKLSARPEAAQAHKFDIGGVVDFVRALVGTMANFHDQMHIDDPAVLARTMFVDTLSVRATDFDLGADDREALFRNGREAALEFLAGWDFERYLADYRGVAR